MFAVRFSDVATTGTPHAAPDYAPSPHPHTPFPALGSSSHPSHSGQGLLSHTDPAPSQPSSAVPDSPSSFASSQSTLPLLPTLAPAGSPTYEEQGLGKGRSTPSPVRRSHGKVDWYWSWGSCLAALGRHMDLGCHERLPYRSLLWRRRWYVRGRCQNRRRVQRHVWERGSRSFDRRHGRSALAI